MHAERLLRTAAVVREKEPGQVDMGHWVNLCKTAACAVGWAAQDPLLQSEGLSLACIPRYRGWYRWEAVRRFYGIELVEAMYLFGSDAYAATHPHPKTVAERIEFFVQEKIHGHERAAADQ